MVQVRPHPVRQHKGPQQEKQISFCFVEARVPFQVERETKRNPRAFLDDCDRNPTDTDCKKPFAGLKPRLGLLQHAPTLPGLAALLHLAAAWRDRPTAFDPARHMGHHKLLCLKSACRCCT